MTLELARDSVLPWECDRNDHLNMQFYSVAPATRCRHSASSRLGPPNSRAADRC